MRNLDEVLRKLVPFSQNLLPLGRCDWSIVQLVFIVVGDQISKPREVDEVFVGSTTGKLKVVRFS